MKFARYIVLSWPKESVLDGIRHIRQDALCSEFFLDSDEINLCLAAVSVPICAAGRSINALAASVSVNPDATLFTRMPYGLVPWRVLCCNWWNRVVKLDGGVSSFRSRNWNRPKTQSRTIVSAGTHNWHRGRCDPPNNGFSDLAIRDRQSTRSGSSSAGKIESYSLPLRQ